MSLGDCLQALQNWKYNAPNLRVMWRPTWASYRQVYGDDWRSMQFATRGVPSLVKV